MPKSTLHARDQCTRARWRKHTRASSVLNILVIERNKQRTERKTVPRGLVIVTVDLFAPGHPQSSTCLGSHNAQLLIKAHSYFYYLSRVSFETEVSQQRSGQSIPLGNVCSGHV